MLGAIHTIEVVNEMKFLHNVKLGYVVYDSCADTTKALHSVQHLLSINGSLPILDDYSEFRPEAKVILGERYSLLSIPIAKLLSVYLFPQISTKSSADKLSDRLRHPSFFRVIPSDVHQTEALAQLIYHFGWNWVGLVSNDEDYGRGAHQSFLKHAAGAGVCVAYEEVIPHYLEHEQSEQRIKEVARRIQQSDAKVVMVILRLHQVKLLFEEMIRINTSRVWIASDSWSRSTLLIGMQDIDKVGDIIGLNFITGKIPGFEHYLYNITVKPGVRNDLIEEYQHIIGCSGSSPRPCSFPIPDGPGWLFGERVAIWAIAHALRDLLRCDDTSCPGETNFPPYKLVEKLRKVNFTLDDDKEEYKYFSEDGDFEEGYDVLLWDSGAARTIGKFNVHTKQVNIFSSSDIVWNVGPNNTKPSSQCSESCKPGYFKKASKVFCCYTCLPCSEGKFSSEYDADECRACQNGTWSLIGQSKCEARRESYLKWSEPYPIALLVAVGIGLLFLLICFVCFIVKRHALIIKASNLLMSCFMMFGLAVSFGSVVLFMDKPSRPLCQAQQALYGLGLTLCVSCILVKAFRTFLAFMAFDPVRRDRLSKLYKPVVIMVLLTSVQGFICLFWLIFDSPGVDPTPPSNQSMVHVLQCSEGSKIGFGVMHGYIALLALVCFLLAFKGRRVPHDFNETGVIIFSILIHLFVWLCFIPIYITKNESRPIVQASAILVSNYGIIFCLLVPKCYRAIFGRNTAEKIRKRLRNFTDLPPSVEPSPLAIGEGEDNRSASMTFGPRPFPDSTDSGIINGSISHWGRMSSIWETGTSASISTNGGMTNRIHMCARPESL
ncbi:G-protein coupled receptor family C group 6 member A-like [Engraulis encrasicolus]|uniref:G-protein coupled receptor family C group 6 member A-like n=1 Tax=Engraulis encrasicolus TaxID=184585 RepID=UPI002FD78983